MLHARWLFLKKGQSLIEVLVGITIGFIFIIGSIAIIAPALQISKQTTLFETQAQLATELMSNVNAWAEGNWNTVLTVATGTANEYYLNSTSSPFTYATGTESVSQSLGGMSVNYLRYFYLSDVYRDANGYVTSTIAGNNYDPSMKLATVVVSSSQLSTMPTFINFYIARSASNNFSQTSWAGGSGVSGAVTLVGTGYALSSDITVSATGSIQITSTGNGCIQ